MRKISRWKFALPARSRGSTGEGKETRKETRRNPLWNALGKTFLLVFALVLVLGCAPAMPAAAADGPYWVEMKYYDSVQIKYKVEHVPGTLDTVTADIPIGGIAGVIDQLYCSDAIVPFHPYASKGGYTSWPGGVTTDKVPNYQPATPHVLSDTARANLNQLYWLVINGFHGTGYNAKTQKFATSNTSTGDSDHQSIRSRYASLEGGDPGQQIDEVIALMATKTAIWHFSNPSFILLSSSLETDSSRTQLANQNRHKLMLKLYDALVQDANKETENGKKQPFTEPALKVTVVPERPEIPATSDVPAQPAIPAGVYHYLPIQGSYYYGPITVQGKVRDHENVTIDKFFLDVSGYGADGVSFVKDMGDGLDLGMMPNPNNMPLNEDQLYGSEQSRPYVREGEPFWLRIPKERAERFSLSSSDVAGGLVVHALARTPEDVSYNDTPMIVVY